VDLSRHSLGDGGNGPTYVAQRGSAWAVTFYLY